MNPEQQTELENVLATLPGLSVPQLFEAFHSARLAKAAASEPDMPYWRSVLIGIGNQLHKRLGPGALQEYAQRFGSLESNPSEPG